MGTNKRRDDAEGAQTLDFPRDAEKLRKTFNTGSAGEEPRSSNAGASDAQEVKIRRRRTRADEPKDG